MKKLGLALLLGSLSFSAFANNSNVIDGSSDPIVLVGESAAKPIYINDEYNNLEFDEIIRGYSTYLENDRELNEEVINSWISNDLLKPLANKFEEKRNPTYYLDNAKVLEPILNKFMTSNFLIANQELNMSVKFTDYDMDKELLLLKPWSIAKPWHSEVKNCNQIALVPGKDIDDDISAYIQLDIDECPYVKMSLSVAEKLWGSNPNGKYPFRLVVYGQGNGTEDDCSFHKCMKLIPKQAKFILHNDGVEIWETKDVIFKVND
ncbi:MULTISPECIES: hypothetical protein [Glaesserella]|uniref:Uncharacterized protein n=1 Tax=Glaesserella australis TaxID=2094024 RepID=A0A328BV60_9PAST|nr:MULTISPECIES: hypothetical protein [Glaesserella]AUI65062.1 hypothetical protein CJD39_00060 [Glaesserella sp. 15-184]RAL18116.1 hypothetical protein C5N92_09545 [Glaesserella australis]